MKGDSQGWLSAFPLLALCSAYIQIVVYFPQKSYELNNFSLWLFYRWRNCSSGRFTNSHKVTGLGQGRGGAGTYSLTSESMLTSTKLHNSHCPHGAMQQLRKAMNLPFRCLPSAALPLSRLSGHMHMHSCAEGACNLLNTHHMLCMI